ncbi:hypothetical protein ACFL45_04435 [Candidatus Neomarinimicrobiota bacterium]
MRILRTFQFSLRFTYVFSIWVCIFIIGAWGCGTSSIYIPIKRPAEINLRDYRKIAVGDVVNESGRKGGHAEDLSGEITNVLLANELFDVLDRQHLARILDEHSLSESGIIDDASATAIGNLPVLRLWFLAVSKPISMLKVLKRVSPTKTRKDVIIRSMSEKEHIRSP